MKTIYKYELIVAYDNECEPIEMPAAAVVLTVREQRGVLCVWALIEPNPALPKTKRYFRIFGTGHAVPEDGDLRYIDTVMLLQGSLVWHIFEHCTAP